MLPFRSMVSSHVPGFRSDSPKLKDFSDNGKGDQKVVYVRSLRRVLGILAFLLAIGEEA